MSRSIHTTRRTLQVARCHDCADPERHAEFLAELEEETRTKRRIKRYVKRERLLADCSALPTDLEHIPIVVRDTGTHIHYPASAEDIREVMRRLPKGVLDGLSSVELSLGIYHQDHMPAFGPEDDPGDPYTGRLGHEGLPGVFNGQVLGQYRLGKAIIRVFAYVYDLAALASAPEMWTCFLRLATLATFVHEVAHHCDATTRIARGRWRMDDPDLAEHLGQQLKSAVSALTALFNCCVQAKGWRLSSSSQQVRQGRGTPSSGRGGRG